MSLISDFLGSSEWKLYLRETRKRLIEAGTNQVLTGDAINFNYNKGYLDGIHRVLTELEKEISHAEPFDE
jgi:hypothetical protein